MAECELCGVSDVGAQLSTLGGLVKCVYATPCGRRIQARLDAERLARPLITKRFDADEIEITVNGEKFQGLKSFEYEGKRIQAINDAINCVGAEVKGVRGNVIGHVVATAPHPNSEDSGRGGFFGPTIEKRINDLIDRASAGEDLAATAAVHDETSPGALLAKAYMKEAGERVGKLLGNAYDLELVEARDTAWESFPGLIDQHYELARDLFDVDHRDEAIKFSEGDAKRARTILDRMWNEHKTPAARDSQPALHRAEALMAARRARARGIV